MLTRSQVWQALGPLREDPRIVEMDGKAEEVVSTSTASVVFCSEAIFDNPRAVKAVTKLIQLGNPLADPAKALEQARKDVDALLRLHLPSS
ncbi:MAG: hypothetical protein AAGA67_13665 [Cyanobacteria bacterium P01_F01_bin.153]